MSNLKSKLATTIAALAMTASMSAQNTTIAHWTFNYHYNVNNGIGTPTATAQTGNDNVNLHDVALLPNEKFLASDQATLRAHRPTIATDANQVNAQDNKGAYLEVNAINCDGAALHMTSPVPTSVEPSTQFVYGENTTAFPDGQAYGYQNPYSYFEIVVSTANYKNIQLEVKAAGHNSNSQYYAVAYSTDGNSWTVVGDEYLTGASYNRWVNQTVALPVEKLQNAYIRIFPAKNWKGANNNVNSDNQFDLDDVYVRGDLDANLAQVTGITIDGQTVTAGEQYDFECKLPKTYTDKTTTFKVLSEYADVSVYAEEEANSDEVEVTDNGDGSYTLDTPKANNAHIITITAKAKDGALSTQEKYTFRLFHAGELMLSKLFVDGEEVDAATKSAINSSPDFTATIADRIYTAVPVVSAIANDGSSPEVTSTVGENHDVTYSLKGDDRTFTLNIQNVYTYTMTERDEVVSIVYSTDGKAAYEPQGPWTDGWTNGLYTLRTTSLDGWSGQQFKFNAVDHLIEVPGGVVVKSVTFEKFGANYNDGEGVTSMTSDGATFYIPTKHGYKRGAKDNLTIVAENHQPGAPIAFSINGGGQPYAQFLLVIEKTDPHTAPAVLKSQANVVKNHAMVSVTFDREMASVNVNFNGKEVHADGGTSLNFGIVDLDYSKQYSFVIPAGGAVDLFGNATTEEIVVNFATDALQPVEKKGYDYVVGTAEEFAAVVKALGSNTSKTLPRVTIFMKNGDYDFGENNEQRIDRGNVSVIGQSRDGVLIHGTRTGISNPILNIRDREGFYLQDLTVRNDLDFRAPARNGVGAAIYGGNKTIMKNVCMQSQQDTQVTGERSYFDHCRIQGTVDFICGGGDQFYDQCELILEGKGAVISAPATTNTTKWGYVFSHCSIAPSEVISLNDGDYTLSRPWQNEPRTYYLYTTMYVQPTANGYAGMSKLPTHFYEYGSMDKDGNFIDLSGRGNSSTSTNSYVPVITEEQAKAFTVMNVLSGTDGWLPTDYSVSLPAPQLQAYGGLIAWEDDSQARAYVIFKDGRYVDHVTTNYFLAAESGTYTVRAVNEMGGMGDEGAAITVDVTAISEVKAEAPANDAIYNLAGQKVDASYKGVVIKNGVKTVQK